MTTPTTTSKPARKPSAKVQKRNDAIEKLRAILPAGSTVYTAVTSVSRSGMSRRIRLWAMVDNAPRSITCLASEALGWTLKEGAGGFWELKVDGCGMDMCFHTVYELGHALYGAGWVGNSGVRDPGYILTARDM